MSAAIIADKRRFSRTLSMSDCLLAPESPFRPEPHVSRLGKWWRSFLTTADATPRFWRHRMQLHFPELAFWSAALCSLALGTIDLNALVSVQSAAWPPL